jgi:hypothetical protein
MKKTIIIAGILAVTAFATAYSAYTYKVKTHHATCTGSKNCNACKNCKYCGHCAKNGGTCGVCK